MTEDPTRILADLLLGSDEAQRLLAPNQLVRMQHLNEILGIDVFAQKV